MIEVRLNLPEDLVEDAREFGLLETEAMTAILRRELDDRVNALVNKEIHDYRAEKRASSSHE